MNIKPDPDFSTKIYNQISGIGTNASKNLDNIVKSLKTSLQKTEMDTNPSAVKEKKPSLLQQGRKALGDAWTEGKKDINARVQSLGIGRMLHEESSKIMTRLKENHRTGKPVNVDAQQEPVKNVDTQSVESKNEVPDPKGYTRIVEESRECFENNEIASPNHIYSDITLGDDLYSQLLNANNEEIKVQNEIVGLRKSLPKTEFVRGKSIPEGGFGAANYARSVNPQNQIDRKLVNLEELKVKTNEALQNLLRNEGKVDI